MKCQKDNVVFYLKGGSTEISRAWVQKSKTLAEMLRKDEFHYHLMERDLTGFTHAMTFLYKPKHEIPQDYWAEIYFYRLLDYPLSLEQVCTNRRLQSLTLNAKETPFHSQMLPMGWYKRLDTHLSAKDANSFSVDIFKIENCGEKKTKIEPKLFGHSGENMIQKIYLDEVIGNGVLTSIESTCLLHGTLTLWYYTLSSEETCFFCEKRHLC